MHKKHWKEMAAILNEIHLQTIQRDESVVVCTGQGYENGLWGGGYEEHKCILLYRANGMELSGDTCELLNFSWLLEEGYIVSSLKLSKSLSFLFVGMLAMV